MSKFSLFLCSCLVTVPLLAQTSPQEFVDFAAQTDMAEAHLGQLAQDKADSQEVKDYANMLITEHTNDYNQLTAVAAKAGLTVPKGLDAKHIAKGAPLEKLKGVAFDRRYLQMMVAGHEEAVATYKSEAAKGQNADLKAYAAQGVPVIQKHLDNAKDLLRKGVK